MWCGFVSRVRRLWKLHYPKGLATRRRRGCTRRCRCRRCPASRWPQRATREAEVRRPRRCWLHASPVARPLPPALRLATPLLVLLCRDPPLLLALLIDDDDVCVWALQGRTCHRGRDGRGELRDGGACGAGPACIPCRLVWGAAAVHRAPVDACVRVPPAAPYRCHILAEARVVAPGRLLNSSVVY